MEVSFSLRDRTGLFPPRMLESLLLAFPPLRGHFPSSAARSLHSHRREHFFWKLSRGRTPGLAGGCGDYHLLPAGWGFPKVMKEELPQRKVVELNGRGCHDLFFGCSIFPPPLTVAVLCSPPQRRSAPLSFFSRPRDILEFPRSFF